MSLVPDKLMDVFSAICVICGFSTVRFKKNTVRCVVTVYTWIVTVIFLTVSLISLITASLHGLGTTTSNTVSAMFVILWTHYRIKYVLNADSYDNILDSIEYVRITLAELFGVKEGRRNEQIKCVLRSLVFIVFNVMYMRRFIYERSMLICSRWVHKMTFYCVCLLTRIIFYISLVCVSTQFVILINRLRHTLRLTYRAVEETIEDTNHYQAWSDNLNDALNLGRRTRRHTEFQIKKLQLIYKCISEAFYAVNKFYALFVNVVFSVYIFTCAIELYSNVFYIHYKDILILALKLSVCVLYPISICATITSEFKRIDGLINNIYYSHRSQESAQHKLQNWLRGRAHTSTRFSCGFIDVDFSLLFLMFEFVTSLLFSILAKNVQFG